MTQVFVTVKNKLNWSVNISSAAKRLRLQFRDMDALLALSEAWPLVVAAVGVIVWLVRLEGRVNQGDKDHEATEKRMDILTTKHDHLDSKVVKELSNVRESLARIEGALGVRQS